MIACKPADEEERLATLYSYGILDTPEEPAFDDITRLLARICNAPVVVINLVDHDRQWFKSQIGLGVRETPLEVSICAHAILQPGLFVVTDTLLDERFADNHLVTGDPHLRFYAGALLETREGFALGTLCVLDYEPRTLTLEQTDALQTLARQVMSELELRRLYAREKRVAETLQRAMMLAPRPGAFLNLAVHAIYEAAWNEAQVGGDFFDSFGLSGGRTALVVGDVSGKGLAAAAHTANAKYALRVFLRQSAVPTDALARLNAYLLESETLEDFEAGTFVALALAVVDSDGHVAMTYAGIDAPLIVRANGEVDAPVEGGPPLGVDRDAFFPMHSTSLGPGDALVMCTDGVTEARVGDSFFGREGVAEALSQAVMHRDVSDIGAAVLNAARTFAGGPLSDDVCLLLARHEHVNPAV